MITDSQLEELCRLTVELTRMRKEEVPHLCIENFAPEVFGKLLYEYARLTYTPETKEATESKS